VGLRPLPSGTLLRKPGERAFDDDVTEEKGGMID
jgi:hypothetical protein